MKVKYAKIGYENEPLKICAPESHSEDESSYKTLAFTSVLTEL